MFTKLECAQKQHGTSTRSGMDVHVYCLRPKSLSAQVVTRILAWKFSTMTQAELMHSWLNAPENRLCAWEVAKALGLRGASKEIHGDKGRLPWIAARLTRDFFNAKPCLPRLLCRRPALPMVHTISFVGHHPAWDITPFGPMLFLQCYYPPPCRRPPHLAL